MCDVFQSDGGDLWVVTHTILPFLVVLFGLHWQHTLLCAYAWESFEAVWKNCWVDSQDKGTVVASLFGDIASACTGILTACILRGPVGERWWYLIALIPTIPFQAIGDSGGTPLGALLCAGLAIGFVLIRERSARAWLAALYILVFTLMVTFIDWNEYFTSWVLHGAIAIVYGIHSVVRG